MNFTGMDFSSSAKFLRNIGLQLAGALLIAACVACAAARAQDAPTENKKSAADARGAYEAALAVSDPVERVAALQRFVQDYPTSEQVGTAREEVVRGLAALGELQLAERNLERAMAYFKQAVAALPAKMSDKFFDETAARIPLAVSVRGYRAEAIALAREVEVRSVGDARKLAALGEFYLAVEDASDALRVLRIGAKLAPNDARLHRTLGAAYRMNLKLTEAAEEYRAAIKLEPEDKRAYYDLANLERARGAYSEATKLYRRQLELDAQHTGSRKGLALAYIADGKDALAAEALQGAGDIRQDFYFQTQLAFAYLTRGQTSEARRAADAALAAEPRFSWARMAAAEVDLAEGKFFDAERNLLAALNYANFPTIYFTLGKVYLTVEDFDGAVEQFAKAFRYSAGKFKAKLGGVLELEAAGVAELLARERQAAIFKFEPPTSEIEFQMIEALVRMDAGLRAEAAPGTVSAIVLSQSSAKQHAAELERAVSDFVEAEGSRRPFRALYAAQRLVKSGRLLERALRLAEEAAEAAETATAPEGSLRDYPNYDREGRLRIFRGRAGELQGWALQRLGRINEAVATLEAAVEVYGPLPERKRALWRLASAKEAAGQESEALELYLAAYEPPDKEARTADLNRAVIEALYRKVNGSLQGLDERIGRESSPPTALIASGARTKPISDAARPLPNVLQLAPAELKAASNAPRTIVPSVKTVAPSESGAGDEPHAAEKTESSGPAKAKAETKTEAKADERAETKAEVKVEEKAEERAKPAASAERDSPVAEKGTPASAEANDATSAKREVLEAVSELPAALPPVKFDLLSEAYSLSDLIAAAPVIEEDLVAPDPSSIASVNTLAEHTTEPAGDAGRGALPETSLLPGWRERPAALAGQAMSSAVPLADEWPFAFESAVPDDAPNPAEISLIPHASDSAAEAAKSAEESVRSGQAKTVRRAKLPSDIESRAAAIGRSSGSLSRSMALDMGKPARAAESPADSAPAPSPAPAASRPRRVTATVSETDSPTIRKRRVTATSNN